MTASNPEGLVQGKLPLADAPLLDKKKQVVVNTVQSKSPPENRAVIKQPRKREVSEASKIFRHYDEIARGEDGAIKKGGSKPVKNFDVSKAISELRTEYPDPGWQDFKPGERPSDRIWRTRKR